MRDFRYAIRTLLRNPGFSLAAVLVLALGIGANSAIFTVIRAVLLAPLPYQQPSRLVNLYERDVLSPGPNVVSGRNFLDWQQAAHSYQKMAAYAEGGASFSPTDGGLPEDIDGTICTADLFATLGVQPAIGRAFTNEEDKFGAPRQVIISDTLWKRRFGSRPDVVGTSARLDGERNTIIGVMPAGFTFPRAGTQIWRPVWQNVAENAPMQRGNHRFNVVARLKPGVTVASAYSELDGIAKQILRDNPGALSGKGATVVRLDEQMVANVRPMLLVLLGAVACVLLIACVNVTNLLLARAVARRREVAVRVAVGASRAQIVKQFLVESSILSFAGAALGLAMAALATDVLIKMAGAIPRIEDVQMNGMVLAFTGAVAIITGIAVGLVPALSSWRAGLVTAMQEGGRSATAGRGRGIFRDSLVAAEVALSLMLLIGAGLLLKSFAKMQTVDAGFNPDRVLTIRFSLPVKRYDKEPKVAEFYETLMGRVNAVPGVESAGLVTIAPLAGHWSDNTFTIEGRAPLPPGHFMDAVVRVADPQYFKAMGIPLKRGRAFTPADRLKDGNKAIVSEKFVTDFFPNEDPIGKRLNLGDDIPREIVGVVGDVRKQIATEPQPFMYFPIARGASNLATLMVRAQGDPNLLSLPLQQVLRSLDADLPAVTVKTMDEIRGASTEQNRFGLTLIALFAGLAVVLASIGLYGVLAYSVGQRTNELGIRIALGATSPDITRLILWQGMKPAAIGIAVGLLAGAAATRWIESLLFEVKPDDPAVMISVAILISLVAAAASFIPAWRAARIDPMVALRAE